MNTTLQKTSSQNADTAADTTVRSYHFGGYDVEMEINDTVFQPTLTSRLLAQVFKIPEGSRVLDLGCGAGVLAIIAALKGASHVHAVDVMEQARPLVEANARRNGVADRVVASSGDLFQPVGAQRFDVIVSDVSGVVDEVSRLSPWYPDSIPTGGHDGADQIVRMLDSVREHLNPQGVLYFPTGTISNIPRTLEAAQRAFGAQVELMEQIEVPFCAEFKENMDVMTRLRAEGLIDFTARRSRYVWTMEIYRAWV